MVNFERREKIDIVTFSENKINALVSDAIAVKIKKVFEISGTKLIIDLSGIEFIDSSGLGCFLTIRRAAGNNYGTLKFANAGERIKELFRMLHLNTILDVHDELQDCIKSFE